MYIHNKEAQKIKDRRTHAQADETLNTYIHCTQTPKKVFHKEMRLDASASRREGAPSPQQPPSAQLGRQAGFISG